MVKVKAMITGPGRYRFGEYDRPISLPIPLAGIRGVYAHSEFAMLLDVLTDLYGFDGEGIERGLRVHVVGDLGLRMR